MSNSPIPHSPFVQIDFSSLNKAADVLSITEHAFLGHVIVRGSPSNKDLLNHCQNVLGLALPLENNTFVSNGDFTVLWYGPDEWLIIGAKGESASLVAKLRAGLGEVFSSVQDISGGNTVLEFAGTRARDLLQKGCPLDLHASVFTTGQCAQSVVAKTSATLYQIDDAPVYRMVVRRSFSDYLGHWLLDAAAEYK